MTRLAGRRDSAFAAILLIVLLALNVALNPARFAPAAWGTLIGLAAPLVAAANAAMPAILGGRGGIDVSVGPLMGFVNAILVQTLILDRGVVSPWALVPAALVVGALAGALNGLLATVVRIQPIVATLGTYLLLSGATLTLVPAPVGAVPAWLKSLAGPLSAVPLAAMAVGWLALKRTPFHEQLMAVGSDDRACFTAGVPVGAVRFLSYVLTGLMGGVAGLMLTALIGSADPTVGPGFTLIAISAVALGGVSLAGGRGGFLAATVGAADIFLLQSALTYFNISTFVLQIAYGLILVASVSLNALPARRWRSMAP
ncbi:MAG: ABC transporter permease [Rhodospirillaceae bacterium]|nr:ABC transporter permease [Rhodospirillaceae bacterium]